MSEGEDAKPQDEDEAKDATSEDAAPEGGNAPEGEDAAEPEKAGLKAKLLGNLKLIIIGVVALLVVGGGSVGIYMSGIFHTVKPHEVSLALPEPLVYHEIPRITVDLKPSARRKRPFIRLTMQVELQGEKAREAFIANEAKIMDTLQTHLRDTTAEALEGKGGTERLREDFTIIINRIINPEVAVTVLYREILIR